MIYLGVVGAVNLTFLAIAGLFFFAPCSVKHEGQEAIVDSTDDSVYTNSVENNINDESYQVGNDTVSGFVDIINFGDHDLRADDRFVPFECGKKIIQHGRILGGTEAVPHSWPWQVAVARCRIFYGGFCGGTIVTPRHTVSAAHCFKEEMPDLELRYGWHFFGHAPEGRVKVTNVRIHPKYSKFLYDYDYALLTHEEIPFSNKVQPACLGCGHPDFDREGWITGWGTEKEGGMNILSLRQVALPIFSECELEIPDDKYYNLCAGGNGKDTCKGDRAKTPCMEECKKSLCTVNDINKARWSGYSSGGPLVQELNGKWYLYGITSWGFGCGDTPGYYAQISGMLTWFCCFMPDLPQCCNIPCDKTGLGSKAKDYVLYCPTPNECSNSNSTGSSNSQSVSSNADNDSDNSNVNEEESNTEYVIDGTSTTGNSFSSGSNTDYYTGSVDNSFSGGSNTDYYTSLAGNSFASGSNTDYYTGSVGNSFTGGSNTDYYTGSVDNSFTGGSNTDYYTSLAGNSFASGSNTDYYIGSVGNSFTGGSNTDYYTGLVGNSFNGGSNTDYYTSSAGNSFASGSNTDYYTGSAADSFASGSNTVYYTGSVGNSFTGGSNTDYYTGSVGNSFNGGSNTDYYTSLDGNSFASGLNNEYLFGETDTFFGNNFVDESNIDYNGNFASVSNNGYYTGSLDMNSNAQIGPSSLVSQIWCPEKNEYGLCWGELPFINGFTPKYTPIPDHYPHLMSLCKEEMKQQFGYVQTSRDTQATSHRKSILYNDNFLEQYSTLNYNDIYKKNSKKHRGLSNTNQATSCTVMEIPQEYINYFRRMQESYFYAELQKALDYRNANNGKPPIFNLNLEQLMEDFMNARKEANVNA